MAFVEVANKLAKDTLRPVMREVEATGYIPQSIVKELHALGLLKMEDPESIGGLELSMISQVQVQRALAFGDLALLQGLPGLNDGASFLRVLQDQNVAKDLFSDEHTIAYLPVIEAVAFSTMKLEQNQLTGTSLPVRSAKIATHFLIAIKNEVEETMLLLIPYQETKQEISGESYLGMSCANIGKITFQQTNVSAEHILAVGEEADILIREAEARIHVLQAAKQVGLMEAACEYVTEYTATRKAFGQEIARFQAVSFRIAKMLTELQVTSHFVLEAACALDEQQPTAYHDAWKTIYQAHKAVKYVTDSAVQLLGGHGYVQDFPVEKWMRDAQAQVMLYGDERAFQLDYGMALLKSSEKVVVG